ncbi:MAG: GntR family transcriptional regulator [Terriglobales bacterium]
MATPSSAGFGSAIPRQSLASAVADKLREKIIRGELREGQQLRQDAIASEFQVSKIPVREALRHLEAEGLIKIIANRGAVVSALSPDEIEQLFEARAVLERHLLGLAVSLLRETDLAEAERVLTLYDQAVRSGAEVEKWGAWNWQFHSSLYQAAKRPLLLGMVKTLNNNCDRYTRMVHLFTGDISRTAREHRELLEACRRRDAEQACELLWRHIVGAGTNLREFIKQQRQGK